MIQQKVNVFVVDQQNEAFDAMGSGLAPMCNERISCSYSPVSGSQS
jgi:hypothetical protein